MDGSETDGNGRASKLVASRAYRGRSSSLVELASLLRHGGPTTAQTSCILAQANHFRASDR